jgi:hypothetical protein
LKKLRLGEDFETKTTSSRPGPAEDFETKTMTSLPGVNVTKLFFFLGDEKQVCVPKKFFQDISE